MLRNTNKENYSAFKANCPHVHSFDKEQEQGSAKTSHIDFDVNRARATLRSLSQDIAAEAKDIVAVEDEAAELPEALWEITKEPVGVFLALRDR